nr:MAG TPA: replisome organizer [Caudoviricetes sp.]
MTRQETGIIMDILTTAYPAFYNGRNAPDMRMTVNLWAEMFAEDDVKIVAAAVKALIATDDKGFPPHIGAVKGRIRQISNPDEMTEQEAWTHIAKALRNSSYNAEEEFSKLPPILQDVVHAPQQLREWARMDEATVQSVVASNLQRSFRAKAQSRRDFESLPQDVQALAKTFAAALPQMPEEPKPAALPPRARTVEDIKADMEKTREILMQQAGTKKKPVAYTPPTPVDWERQRQDALRRFREVAQ